MADVAALSPRITKATFLDLLNSKKNSALERLSENDLLLDTPLNDNGEYPLHIAVRTNNPEIFKHLLEKGANPNVTCHDMDDNSKNRATLRPIDLARKLYLRDSHYSSGSSEDSESDEENTPTSRFHRFQKALNTALEDACSQNDSERIKALLAAGAKTTAATRIMLKEQDPSGLMALIIWHKAANINKRASKDDSTPLLFTLQEPPQMAQGMYQTQATADTQTIIDCIEKRQNTNLNDKNKTSLEYMKKRINFRSIDINRHDPFGFQPMHVAAYHGDLEVVQLLISLGASEQHVPYPEHDDTATSDEKDKETLQPLIDKSASTNTTEENQSPQDTEITSSQRQELQARMQHKISGDSALHIAVREKHTDVVAALLGHIKPASIHNPPLESFQGKSGSTLQKTIPKFNQTNTPRYNNLAKKNKKEETVFDVASTVNNSAISALLNSYQICSDIRKAVRFGITQSPQATSGSSSKQDRIADLFKKLETEISAMPGVTALNEIDLRDDDGISPLHIAAEKHDTDSIKALNDHMSEHQKEALNKNGWTALHVLAENNSADTAALKNATDALLEGITDDALNAKTPNNPNASHGDLNGQCTALHIAVHSNNTTVIESLKNQKSIELLIENGYGMTALESAVYFRKPGPVKLLVGKQRNTGMTLEDLLAKPTPTKINLEKGDNNDFTSVLKTLIQHGIKPSINAKSNNNQNHNELLRIVIEENNFPAAILLLNNGATCRKSYGPLWRKKPLAMFFAHCLKLLVTLLCLPLMLFGLMTVFKKSSYCKLALGTCRLSAFFDGRLLKSSTRKKDIPTQVVPKTSSSKFQENTTTSVKRNKSSLRTPSSPKKANRVSFK